MSIQSVAASAKRALKTTTPKAKRGDVFVLETTSQYTSANFKVTESVGYCFAIAAKVDRQGIVTEWTKRGMDFSHPIDKTRERVLLITNSDLQGAARDVYSPKLDNFFTSPDQIRALVLDRAEALR